MSLIDDALKRARDEAALQDQEGRRSPLPQRQGGRPPSAGGGRALAIGLAAGVLVSLLAYQAYRATVRPEPQRSPPPAPAAAHPPSPLPEVAVPPPISAQAGKARSGAEHARSGRANPAPGVKPDSPPAATVSAASAPGEGKGKRPRDGESFSRSVSLPGGSRIELEGIVYSDTRPVALVNGKVMAPGDTVEGFTIVKISPDRIKLQDHERTISILAK
jgi:ferric-dicitrate binding protein FerR (iron transport regulator)